MQPPEGGCNPFESHQLNADQIAGVKMKSSAVNDDEEIPISVIVWSKVKLMTASSVTLLLMFRPFMLLIRIAPDRQPAGVWRRPHGRTLNSPIWSRRTPSHRTDGEGGSSAF
jgi:hypothetical protein